MWLQFYMVKSFSQDLSTNFAVQTAIKPAEPHSLLSTGQYSLPSADSQLPLLIHSFHCWFIASPCSTLAHMLDWTTANEQLDTNSEIKKINQK